MKLILKVTLITFAVCLLPAQANDQVKAFFQEYVALNEGFDPAVADLYDDNARILAYRVYPHGLERALEMSGVDWKQLLVKLMPLAKAQNDKSTFSNLSISPVSEGFKIKADRYSVRKCYTDTGYFMVVRPAQDGRFLIIKEYMETQPLPSC